MSYPLINGSTINGSESAAPSVIKSLAPVRFGTPALAFVPASLAPVAFGEITLKIGTDVTVRPRSLQPVRIGVPQGIREVAPSSTVFPVRSLRPVRHGVPAVALDRSAGVVSSLQPVRLTGLLAVVALPAQSLQPVTIGTPGSRSGLSVRSLRPAALGAPSSIHLVSPAALRVGRLGRPGGEIGGINGRPTSLRPVVLGTPSLGATSMRARSLLPVRWGRPTIDRGTAC